MKFIVAGLILLIAASAQAQSLQVPSCFKKIHNIAKSLGVKPGVAGDGNISVAGCDGKSYDLMVVIEKLIERMDKAAKK